MSYDLSDASHDEFYDAIARELYPAQKAQAIGEFTSERLSSFYLSNPTVMRPAVEAILEGRRLSSAGHPSAALVFFVAAVELLLKATVLKPIIHGLVHSGPLAEVVVEQAFGQAGFDRYTKLLSRLYLEFAGVDIASIARTDANQNLLLECSSLQGIRNKIIHQGATCTLEEAELGLQVAVAVYERIVVPVLSAIGLTVVERGTIEAKRC